MEISKREKLRELRSKSRAELLKFFNKKRVCSGSEAIYVSAKTENKVYA